MEFASRIDHTLLKPDISLAEVEKICDEAVSYGFAAVCIPPLFVKAAKARLGKEKPAVATVIGFPFGYSAVEAKLAETILAIVDGANELDIVINIAALKNNDWQYLANELNTLLAVIRQKGRVNKWIIESGILSDEEIIRCCDLYGAAGVDFLKTSTGYAAKGASVHAVTLMRKHAADGVKIKASGGIRDRAFAEELVAAGADRLGCSSSIEIIEGITVNGAKTY